MDKLVLGLMGEKESGKSSVADILAQDGFTVLEPGMQVMELVYDINPSLHTTGPYFARARDIYDAEGYQGFKRYPEGRRLLQEFGTRIRERDPIFWVEQQRRVIEGAYGDVVNTSVRFPNEAQLIMGWDGFLILVERPDLDHNDGHVSEHAWRDIQPDVRIMNDGTLSDLADTVRTTVNLLR